MGKALGVGQALGAGVAAADHGHTGAARAVQAIVLPQLGHAHGIQQQRRVLNVQQALRVEGIGQGQQPARVGVGLQPVPGACGVFGQIVGRAQQGIGLRRAEDGAQGVRALRKDFLGQAKGLQQLARTASAYAGGE